MTIGSQSTEVPAALPAHHEIAAAATSEATSAAADLSRYAQTLFTSNSPSNDATVSGSLDTGFGAGYLAGVAAPVSLPYAYFSGSGSDSDTPAPSTSPAYKLGEVAGVGTDGVVALGVAAGIWGPDEVVGALGTAAAAAVRPLTVAGQAIFPDADSAYVTAGRTAINDAFGTDVGAQGWAKAFKALSNVTNDDQFTAFINQLQTEGKEFGSRIASSGEDTFLDLKDAFG